MIKPNSDVFKKHFLLTAAGVALQVLGNVCFLAATLGVMKEINTQIRQTLTQELSK